VGTVRRVPSEPPGRTPEALRLQHRDTFNDAEPLGVPIERRGSGRHLDGERVRRNLALASFARPILKWTVVIALVCLASAHNDSATTNIVLMAASPGWRCSTYFPSGGASRCAKPFSRDVDGPCAARRRSSQPNGANRQGNPIGPDRAGRPRLQDAQREVLLAALPELR